MNDDTTSKSRHAYIATYKNMPIMWDSQLQGLVVLISTESKYIGLSSALRTMIPVINLMQELKTRGFPIDTSKPRVRCKLFEDNSGAIEMAKVPKMRPRTKTKRILIHSYVKTFRRFSSVFLNIIQRAGGGTEKYRKVFNANT